MEPFKNEAYGAQGQNRLYGAIAVILKDALAFDNSSEREIAAG